MESHFGRDYVQPLQNHFNPWRMVCRIPIKTGRKATPKLSTLVISRDTIGHIISATGWRGFSCFAHRNRRLSGERSGMASADVFYIPSVNSYGTQFFKNRSTRINIYNFCKANFKPLPAATGLLCFSQDDISSGLTYPITVLRNWRSVLDRHELFVPSDPALKVGQK